MSLANVNLMISEGHSFSGHEPNCAFLNMQDGRFATISSIAGFDFPDDARGVAITDWDRDGDVDVWLSNRTAPRLRLLLNQTETSHRHVAIRLVGTVSNRDGIGARVMATPRGSGKPLTATCRAGDGYLAQSSKWLHLGLGSSDRLDRIEIVWPSGTRDVVENIPAGRRYVVREGEGRARPLETAPAAMVVSPAPAANTSSPSGVRIPLTDPIPLPALPYRDSSGAAQQVDFSDTTLVTLWASWCAPCIRELREYTKYQEQLRQAGVQIVALCVDQHAGTSAVAPEQAQRLLEQMEFPFISGYASEETVARLHTLLETPFKAHLDVATPTSILVDDQGKLLAIYRGPAQVGQVIEDARVLPTLKSFAALPFTGKWLNPPRQTDILQIALELLNRGHLEDAAKYVRENQARLASNKEFAKLAVWIGDESVKRGNDVAGLEFYKMALAGDVDDMVVMNNVAWQLATNPDQRVRDGNLAVRWAERAAELTNHQDPNVLATLAVSYAEADRFDEAIQTSTRAVELARSQGNRALEQSLEQRMQLFRSGRPYRSR